MHTKWNEKSGVEAPNLKNRMVSGAEAKSARCFGGRGTGKGFEKRRSARRRRIRRGSAAAIGTSTILNPQLSVLKGSTRK